MSAPLAADTESSIRAPVLFCILSLVLSLFDKYMSAHVRSSMNFILYTGDNVLCFPGVPESSEQGPGLSPSSYDWFYLHRNSWCFSTYHKTNT